MFQYIMYLLQYLRFTLIFIYNIKVITVLVE